jgi:prophage DNA circulation protein
MASEFHVDLTQLSRELKETDKKFAAAMRKNIRAAVAESGAELLQAMREKASWSKRIPAATSIATAFSTRAASVRIKTDKKKAPHARPYEMGSKAGGGGQLRHPVFGRKTWVVENTRPFFFAAVEAKTTEIDAKMQAAVDRIVTESGFKGA